MSTSALADAVFDGFPYGIVVLTARGAVLTANPRAREMLPSFEPGETRCCELFGCNREGTALAGGCLVDLAAEHDGRLPEMRVDLPAGSAAWLKAALLGGEPGQIVLQLRPADPRDRRRRTAPHWSGAAQLRIVALGRTRVESREGPIGGAWLEQRPGQLLKLLVTQRKRVVSVEEIAGALWPDAGRKALGSVRHTVHELRDRLEPERAKRRPSSFVVYRQGGYTLDRRRVSIDAEEFEVAVELGVEAAAEGRPAPAIAALGPGLALYEGDFLAEDPYEVWTFDERDRLRALAARGLALLAGLHGQSGSLDLAHEALVRYVALEPFDVQIQRELISNCLLRGRRSEAKRRYSLLRQRMLHEFGEVLDFELADLRASLAIR